MSRTRQPAAVARDWLRRAGWTIGSALCGASPAVAQVPLAPDWAHAPLAEVRVPPADAEPGQVRHAIDALVARRQAEHGLRPAPEASRRQLIRRLSFDLLGLPPEPAEIARFVDDPSSDAYERLVDAMLASPHFGERMARHWLDVARFGESDGFEHDGPRPFAWRYRDWVVRAFNEDMPFDRFARCQIAGDVLEREDPAAAVATGFLVAGPWDRVAHTQFSKKRRAGARQDELQEIVGVTAQAFLGMTLHCARCHDHKNEPITQADYYRFAAALAGVGRGDRDVTPQTAERTEWTARRRSLRAELEAIERPIREHLEAQRGHPRPVISWSCDRPAAEWTMGGAARLGNGALVLDGKSAYAVSKPLSFGLVAKTLEVWVELDSIRQFGGAVVSVAHAEGGVFDAIVFGGSEPGRWMVGSENFARTRSFGGAAEDGDGVVHLAVTFAADGTITAYRNGRRYGTSYRVDWPVTFAKGQARILIGFPRGDAPPSGLPLVAGRIHRVAVHDTALSASQVARSGRRPVNAIAQADFARGLAEATLHRRAMVIAELERVERRIERGTELGYCVVPTVPDPIRVLPRGQAGAAGPLVAPGGVEVVRTSSPDFGLGADSSDAARRRRLAEWMTGAGNPVFARVAVNRIWAQLFGRGLVTTPSDFGRTGARPSHPQLLEWLAKWFATSGYRIKALVRELVCCATYRQATEAAEVMVRADPTNRWLARRGVKRLEAEAIRDAILVASGCLDRTLGGPSDRDFDVVTRGPTFFYEPKEVGWSAGPSGKPMARRSLYRMWARGGRNRLFEAFDCPDPSVATPVRAQTTTPLQALALLNSELVSVMAAAMARRVQSEYHSSTAQLTAAYELALGRPPTAGEAAKMEPLLREYGLSVLARALFNSHEFVHVH